MYEFFIAGVRLPVTPAKIQTKVPGRNKTITLMNEGEVNLLKMPGLLDLSFEALLPQTRYPFAKDGGSPKRADYYTELLEKLFLKKKPFRFIITRSTPGGRLLFDTNILVSLEDYTIQEDYDEGFDLMVSISLKEYRKFGTKTVQLQKAKVLKTSSSKPVEYPPAQESYTVVKGDCLYNIAQLKLGNGKRYPEIYALNKALMDAGNAGTGYPKYTIYPRQVLKLPKV